MQGTNDLAKDESVQELHKMWLKFLRGTSRGRRWNVFKNVLNLDDVSVLLLIQGEGLWYPRFKIVISGVRGN